MLRPLVSYTDLAERHGRQAALKVLYALEQLAQIRNEIISLDLDDRFKKALTALSEIDFAR